MRGITEKKPRTEDALIRPHDRLEKRRMRGTSCWGMAKRAAVAAEMRLAWSRNTEYG
jgi:hypothetical protein